MVGLWSTGLPVTEITVKINSVVRGLAALVSGAEENNRLYAPAEEQRTAQGVVQSREKYLIRGVLPFC